MKVLQLIDSLHPGGAERMAISLANGLAQSGIESHLCVTREEGLLNQTLSPEVSYLFLQKKRTIDIAAYRKLRTYIRQNHIDVIHAHSSSFFLATWVKLSIPKLRLIWHDHFGESELLDTRNTRALKLCSAKFDGIIAVNEKLEYWAKLNLRCSDVVFLRNFVDLYEPGINSEELKGKKGHRIVCLANFRPQKDHFTLLKAFGKLVKKYPDWSLHLIGKKVDLTYTRKIEEAILADGMSGVFIYGEQLEIMNLLSQAQIGVLSSRSEGLPVALLEYGIAGLAVIATKVGQCESVVKDHGILVPAGSSDELAFSLARLMEDAKLRKSLAKDFNKHINEEYTFESIKSGLLKLYTKDV